MRTDAECLPQTFEKELRRMTYTLCLHGTHRRLRELAALIGDRDTACRDACLLVADLIDPPKGVSRD